MDIDGIRVEELLLAAFEGAEYTFDGDGNPVKSRVRSNFDRYLLVTPAGGAMRQDGTLYYVLGNQLGSANVTLDSSGNVVGETRYYPFGQTRYATGSMFTDKLYTGQRFEEELGLYYYVARWYDLRWEGLFSRII